MDKNLLSNATSSDDAPTPGYMLSEIASKNYIDDLNPFLFVFGPRSFLFSLQNQR
jgi:hypothetical protein